MWRLLEQWQCWSGICLNSFHSSQSFNDKVSKGWICRTCCPLNSVTEYTLDKMSHKMSMCQRDFVSCELCVWVTDEIWRKNSTFVKVDVLLMIKFLFIFKFTSLFDIQAFFKFRKIGLNHNTFCSFLLFWGIHFLKCYLQTERKRQCSS